MSSLSQQLGAISEKSGSVVLDRKTRAKVHSKSLIFDPKVASTQDFDLLHSIGVEGLDQLCEVDSRFEKFRMTLFLDTSITFDRNVQQQDTLVQLQKTIDGFLILVAPYYQLTPSIKAVEWLVRRFSANIHNAEMLLLTSLPYYKYPVFVKMMNVIPKPQFPPIFQWLQGYKDMAKSPPMASILKGFYNDFELVKLYSFFFMDQIKNNTLYKDQLMFYLSISVQVLVAMSKDTSKITELHLPLYLETVGKLLLPYPKLASDLRLTAYSIVSVLSSIIPLSSDVIVSLTLSILQSPGVLETGVKQTIIVLGQLWNSIPIGTPPQLLSCFDHLPVSVLVNDNLVMSIIEEGFNLNTFLTYYFIYKLSDAKITSIFTCIDLSVSYSVLAHACFEAVNNDQESTRDNVIYVLTSLLKSDANLFSKCLHSYKQDWKVSDLEMTLMTTLDNNEDNDGDIELEQEDEDEDEDAKDLDQDVSDDLQQLKTKCPSFFTSNSTQEFNSLSKSLIKCLRQATTLKKLKATISQFCKTVLPSAECSFSFLLRLSLTQSFPLASRIQALTLLRTRITNINKSDHKVDTYLLLPIVLLGLYDNNKSIRQLYLDLLALIKKNTIELHDGNKRPSCTLFMEDAIYGDIPKAKRAIISPKDGLHILKSLNDDLDDVIVDKERIHGVLKQMFTLNKSNQKKFGQLLVKSFILKQWALSYLPLCLKHRAWVIIGNSNNSDDKAFFTEGDVFGYINKRNDWIQESIQLNIDFEVEVEKALVNLLGGPMCSTSDIKLAIKEVDWIISALTEPTSLQQAVSSKIIDIFGSIASIELQAKIYNKLIDLLTNEDIEVNFDPYLVLQSLPLTFALIIQVLQSVQIASQVPEQGVAKRRRRSSSQTRQNMARTDISNMASGHLKKLTTVLDLLGYNLHHNSNDMANPDLLTELFKILTDLDHLGSVGRLPILYAQESLASCMLVAIKTMKLLENDNKDWEFDSNSIRADLIVNSIRNSQSPQAQNRLLLVIAELASLAPEIILHSVMPIFTFMGAHTIRQDDEFSNSALQETVSRVIPALANNGTTNINDDIEFLLASFVAALQHIPRHRRTKLFGSLVKTLTVEQSLHVILFLVGTQYSHKTNEGKSIDSTSLIEFSTSLLKSLSPTDQLNGIVKLFSLWEKIPTETVEKGSEQYDSLVKRPIFGASIVSMTQDELLSLKVNLLLYINELIKPNDTVHDISLLKLKIGIILLDDDIEEGQKRELLKSFNASTSFVLSNIDSFTNTYKNPVILNKLYLLLSDFLDILPISSFIDSIIDSLDCQLITDKVSIKVAKNFALLANQKFDQELNTETVTSDIRDTIVNRLIPILINGLNKNLDLELQQAYLDTYATIIQKLSNIEAGVFDRTKSLIDSLAIVTSDKCLLSSQPELIISSVSVLTNIINVLGVKCIGYFPKIIKPSLDIWSQTSVTPEDDTNDDGEDVNVLVQTAILLLFSSIIKKLPAFITTNFDDILLAIIKSELVEPETRSNILDIVVEHMDYSQVLKTLITIWTNDKVFTDDSIDNLMLYLEGLEKTIDGIDKKAATTNSTLFMKWLIKSFEFRNYCDENEKFNINAIYRFESSFHKCGIKFVMKLNDKSFRPLFASLSRWAISGEGSNIKGNNSEIIRLLAFFRFFNKLQEELKSIITSYYSYVLEGVTNVLIRFQNNQLNDITLRRLVLISLTSSFKYDQDDYWTQELRFEMIYRPLIDQLTNIEDSIGKYLVKTISAFSANVSSEEYNTKILNELIKFISNDTELATSSTKTWCVRVLKTLFQKFGEQWLSHLPTLVPYIAELLEDDDEQVELEVRRGLVKVIEKVLGEPLDRYLE